MIEAHVALPNEKLDTQGELDEFLHASYLYTTAVEKNKIITSVTPGSQYRPWDTPVYTLDKQAPDYLRIREIVDPIFTKYGTTAENWRGFLSQVLGIDPNKVVLAYPRDNPQLNFNNQWVGGYHDAFVQGYKNLYGLDYTQETKFKTDILSGSASWYLPRSTGGGGGVFDTLFSGGYIKTFVENPISAVQSIIERFTNPVGTNLPTFVRSGVDPPKVDFTRIGVQSGINTVANVGFAFGVEGASQGIQAANAASRALPAGTYGATSPGFWASLGEGNFANAWQIAKNTLGVATGGPSTFVSRQGSQLLAQESVSTFVRYTGDIGKGILQLVTLDLAGALKSFGIDKGPNQPGNIIYPFGNFGGGGSSGGGFLPSQKVGQVSSSVIPFVLIGGAIVLIWLLFRKAKT